MGCCCQCKDRDSDKPYEFDPTFDGIIKERRCTDIGCCIVFLLYFCGMLAVLFVTIPKSNYKYLYIPTDHRGLMCGYDNSKVKVDDADDLPNLEDKKYLFWVRPGKPGYSRSFCVEKCPEEGYFLDAFNGMVNISKNHYIGFEDDHVCGNFSGVLVTANVENYSMPENDSDRWFCPYASHALLMRCMPKPEAFDDIGEKITDFVKNAIENVSFAMDAVSYVSRAVQDTYDLLWPMAACVGGALILSILWLLLLRCVAVVMVWVTILLAAAGLAFVTYMCYGQWKDKWNNQDVIEQYTFGFITTDLNQKIFQVFFWILIAVDVIFVLLMIFLFSRIMLSIKVIGLVSKLLFRIPSLFFFPIVLYLIMVAWWVYVVGVGCVLFGAGTPERVFESYTDNDPYAVVDKIEMKYDTIIQGFVVYHLVGGIWITCFLVALGEMTIAGVVAQWFFMPPNEQKKMRCCSCMVTRSFFRCLRYHIGTLALGSFIITICKLVRMFIEYVDRKTKNSQSNLAKCCIKCMKCCFWCLEKFLKYLNRNIYILTAIHGYSFCPGCCKAFNLILRNIIRVGTLNFVGDFTLFLGRVFVAGAATAVAVYIFPIIKTGVQCLIVPAVIVFLCSWLASGAFTGTFEMGIDAMFLCFLEDEERNDDSPGRERRTPKSLRKYVDKHEKKTEHAEEL